MATQQSNTGFFLVGKLMGCRLHESGNYKNYYLGVCTGEQQQSYGPPKDYIEEISISEDQWKAFPNDLINQPVRIQVGFNVRHGASAKAKGGYYAIRNVWMIKDSAIEPLNKASQLKQASGSN